MTACTMCSFYHIIYWITQPVKPLCHAACFFVFSLVLFKHTLFKSMLLEWKKTCGGLHLWCSTKPFFFFFLYKKYSNLMTNVLEDLTWLISAELLLLIPQRTEQWLPHLDRTEWCCSVLQLRANESKKSLPVFVLGNGKLALLAYATNQAVSCWLICHDLVVLCMGTHPWKLSSHGMCLLHSVQLSHLQSGSSLAHLSSGGELDSRLASRLLRATARGHTGFLDVRDYLSVNAGMVVCNASKVSENLNKEPFPTDSSPASDSFLFQPIYLF